MSDDAVDVVTVPDFTGPAAAQFELRTLLFLGSWLEHGGASREWPLHLACIGRPPDSVRRLGHRAGVSITIHEPLAGSLPVFNNKLRAFEITPTHERLLLVDTDTLILRDLAPMAGAVGGGIGVCPATYNHLPEAIWKQVFEWVGVPYPSGTGFCWAYQLGTDVVGPAGCWESSSGMPPYFNSGVLLTSWSTGLGDLWRRHLLCIAERFGHELTGELTERITYVDQYALATAVSVLQQAGVRVELLPLAYQARLPLLVAGVLTWDDVALFHYAQTPGIYGITAGDLARLLYGTRLAAVRRWLAQRFGLRFIRSPVYRLVEPRHLRAIEGFYIYTHRIFQKYVR